LWISRNPPFTLRIPSYPNSANGSWWIVQIASTRSHLEDSRNPPTAVGGCLQILSTTVAPHFTESHPTVVGGCLQILSTNGDLKTPLVYERQVSAWLRSLLTASICNHGFRVERPRRKDLNHPPTPVGWDSIKAPVLSREDLNNPPTAVAWVSLDLASSLPCVGTDMFCFGTRCAREFAGQGPKLRKK